MNHAFKIISLATNLFSNNIGLSLRTTTIIWALDFRILDADILNSARHVGVACAKWTPRPKEKE